MLNFLQHCHMNVQAFYIIIFYILAKPFSPSNTENNKMTRLIMIFFYKVYVYVNRFLEYSLSVILQAVKIN